ncbi:MAG: hypothetical protein U1F20_04195 [Lysobacterales bacterium]
MSTTYDPNEYEAIARLFDLVCEGNGNQFELDQLDSQIAKGLEQAYHSEQSAAPTAA